MGKDLRLAQYADLACSSPSLPWPKLIIVLILCSIPDTLNVLAPLAVSHLLLMLTLTPATPAAARSH